MNGRKTSIYLPLDLEDELHRRGISLVAAARLGIESLAKSDSSEMTVLKAVARTLLEVRDAVVCDCLGAPRGHLAGATPACSGKIANALVTP